MATMSPFNGTAGFLSLGAWVTAYLIPEGKVIISGPAKDDCGDATIPSVPATAAAVLVKKERLSSPPLTEKEAADEMHKRRAMAEKKDFMVQLTLALDYERTGSKEIVDMVNEKFEDAEIARLSDDHTADVVARPC